MPTKIVHISSNWGTSCNHCSFPVGGHEHFETGVNHYVSEHSYEILHLGTEEIAGLDEQARLANVAILGKCA